MFSCRITENPPLPMKVVRHELGAWHLFAQGDDFYLDMRTGKRGHGFWLLLKLESSEALSYRQAGKVFLGTLIDDILRGAISCLGRRVPTETQWAALDALTTWRRSPSWPRV